MDLRKAVYTAQLSNPEGREECVVQYEGGRCRMTRAEMASARGVEFQYERTLPSGKPLYKALVPSTSGRSMKKSAGTGVCIDRRKGDYWELQPDGSWKSTKTGQVMRGAPDLESRPKPDADFTMAGLPYKVVEDPADGIVFKKSIPPPGPHDNLEQFSWLADELPEVDRNRRKLLGLIGLGPVISDVTMAGVPYDFGVHDGTIALKKSVGTRITGEYTPFSHFYLRSPALTKTTGSDRDELMFGSIHVMN